MTVFQVHTIESAPESKELLDSAKNAYGFVPNLLAIMAESPALLEGYMTLASIFDKSDLSATEQQIIMMVNNRLNGCTYCMSAHTGISKAQGVSDEIINALRDGTPISDPKLEALRVFAIRINESRGWPTQDEINSLISVGYTQRTIFEVILGTSLKIMSNYTNHIASTPLDEQFKPVEWTANELVDSIQ